MRADLLVKGKSLTGSSDLTLLAPLRLGLVPSLESVSYKTRAQRLLKLLNGGRSSSHEFALERPISDSVERVARIHSFRVAVLEPEDKVLLAVTFDGTWESYIRVLWQKVGTLLDVIFCNTEGYVHSSEGFDAWCGWVNRVQVETGFFFNTHALTVGDVHYLRAQELKHRSAPNPAQASLNAARLCSRSAEEAAYEVGQTTPLNAIDTLRQGLQALALLFRLTDLYLPGTQDGDVLLSATRDLLSDFCPLIEDPDLIPEIAHPIRDRFDRQLSWLRAASRPELARPRALPPLPPRPVIATPDDVQGGILAGYDEVTHACLVLLAFDDAKAGGAFLAPLRARVTTAVVSSDGPFELDVEGGPKHLGPGPFINVAVTFEGLRQLGLSEAELNTWLPPEFREGMEARASMLGDFRANHPRRWPLPRTNWDLPGGTAPVEIQMSAVHMVVQIRAKVTATDWVDDPNDSRYALRDEIRKLANEGEHPRDGVRVLCVQPMQRMRNGDGRVMEHFGFADGEGQPEFTGPPNEVYPNQVNIGEVLLGYANEADPAPTARTSQDEARLSFLRNGSFMVVRKLRQYVPRLRKAVRDGAEKAGLEPSLVLAKMMGRWQRGGSLITYPDKEPTNKEPPDKHFTFDGDAQGSRCPFHAHIRRVNPRSTSLGQGEPPGRRRARIVRRGMAYGPQASTLPGDPKAPDEGDCPGDELDRGLVFIAYNASIAEQFDVVQSWISGGNSTGGFSGQSDPLLGVPEPGQQRVFRFEATKNGAQEAFSILLDSGPTQFEEPEPFVRLEWGAYLFVPSMRTLAWLQHRADSVGLRLPVWLADEGRCSIERLGQMLASQGEVVARDAWKCAVEDPGAQEQLQSASLWAAVRERRAGALRTPYGVLVASRALVDEVLGDDQRFSVCGYRKRMFASHFDIYLGLDHGSRYIELSKDVNAAIGEITKAEAFTLAATATEEALNAFMKLERDSTAALKAQRWELNLDAKEVIDKVQQRLCQEWLGLPERGGPLVPGSWRWDWKEGDPPIYPVHFTPPSRYYFQPWPGDDVRSYGERYAAALTAALEAFVKPHRAQGTLPTVPGESTPARLAKAILEALPREDDATVARTFAGVLMGFLPTLDGNLRLVLNEWLRLQTLWSLRATWSCDARPIGLDKAQELLEPALMQAMQFRSSPELIWRTAQHDHDRIGDVPLARGDVVVVALVSAMHEGLAKGQRDVMPAFGGDRCQPSHPTHACPGYAAAMGVLLGVLAAFVDVKETMRPSPAPLAFTFEGPLP